MRCRWLRCAQQQEDLCYQHAGFYQWNPVASGEMRSTVPERVHGTSIKHTATPVGDCFCWAEVDQRGVRGLAEVDHGENFNLTCLRHVGTVEW